MRVGVLGATSRLGQCTVEALAEHEVVPLLRRSDALPGARRLDLGEPTGMGEALAGLEVVVSVAGAPIVPWPVLPRVTFEGIDRDGHRALGLAARREGVRRVVYVSVFGEGMEHLAYVRAHHEAEAALREAVPEVVAARPVGLFGAFDQLVPMARLGLGVDLQGGRALTNPVSERDLAAVLAQAVVDEAPAEVQAVGGPDVLTRAQIWDLAFAAQGRGGVHLPSHPALLTASARALRLVDRRAADVLDFLRFILTHDGVAPQVGTERLADYWS